MLCGFLSLFLQTASFWFSLAPVLHAFQLHCQKSLEILYYNFKFLGEGIGLIKLGPGVHLNCGQKAGLNKSLFSHLKFWDLKLQIQWERSMRVERKFQISSLGHEIYINVCSLSPPNINQQLLITCIITLCSKKHSNIFLIYSSYNSYIKHMI